MLQRSSLAGATTIPAGSNFFETVETVLDFARQCIPAGFFGPGSRPFCGIIRLTGFPFEENPFFKPVSQTGVAITTGDPPNLGNADTVVTWKDPFIPKPGETVRVKLELVWLSLKSIDPIRVTFGGNGNQSSIWNVEVQGRGDGWAEVHQTDPGGGVFEMDVSFPKLVDYVFINTNNPNDIKFFDAESFPEFALHIRTPRIFDVSPNPPSSFAFDILEDTPVIDETVRVAFGGELSPSPPLFGLGVVFRTTRGGTIQYDVNRVRYSQERFLTESAEQARRREFISGDEMLRRIAPR